MTRLTHGKARTTEHRLWCAIRSRCNSPTNAAYADYGGRGITVCARWDDFEAFLADMGPRPPNMTLDRRDNNGSYSPENCRWATRQQQSENRRNALLVEIDGRTLNLSQWAKERGLSYGALHQRIANGWDPVMAVLTPVSRSRAGIRHGSHRYAPQPA